MLMTAKEAREKSKRAFSLEIIEKLQEVEVLISATCAEGEVYCVYEESLPVQVIRQLQLNGYCVYDWSDRKHSRMAISW